MLLCITMTRKGRDSGGYVAPAVGPPSLNEHAAVLARVVRDGGMERWKMSSLTM